MMGEAEEWESTGGREENREIERGRENSIRVRVRKRGREGRSEDELEEKSER